MDTPAIIYRTDREDRIVSVNDAWTKFARENDGESVVAEKVVGRRIWDFVQDDRICGIYRFLIDDARNGRDVRFKFRCDSPAERRVFSMQLRSDKAGEVEWTSRLLLKEPREPIALLSAHLKRGASMVRICSWCHRVLLDEETWQDLETAVEQLKLLEMDPLPRLTHGICPDCQTEVMSEFRREN
jgi:hypothetical protein